MEGIVMNKKHLAIIWVVCLAGWTAAMAGLSIWLYFSPFNGHYYEYISEYHRFNRVITEYFKSIPGSHLTWVYISAGAALLILITAGIFMFSRKALSHAARDAVIIISAAAALVVPVCGAEYFIHRYQLLWEYEFRVTDNKTLVARDGTRYNYLTYEDTYYFDWGTLEAGEKSEFLGTIRGDEIFHFEGSGVWYNAAIGGVWTVEGCPDDSFLRVTRSNSEFWYIYVREDIDLAEICWDNAVSVSFSKSDAEPLKGEALTEFYNDIIGNPETYESYEELTKFAD